MKNDNWPSGVNYGHSNFTGKTPRTSAHSGGSWGKREDTIPASAWLGAIAVVALLFVVAYVGAAAGF